MQGACRRTLLGRSRGPLAAVLAVPGWGWVLVGQLRHGGAPQCAALDCRSPGMPVAARWRGTVPFREQHALRNMPDALDPSSACISAHLGVHGPTQVPVAPSSGGLSGSQSCAARSGASFRRLDGSDTCSMYCTCKRRRIALAGSVVCCLIITRFTWAPCPPLIARPVPPFARPSRAAAETDPCKTGLHPHAPGHGRVRMTFAAPSPRATRANPAHAKMHED